MPHLHSKNKWSNYNICSFLLEGTAGHLSSLTSAVDAQNINPNTQEIKQAPHARHARFCQGNSCACPQGNCVFEQPFTPPPNYVPKPGNHGSNGAG